MKSIILALALFIGVCFSNPISKIFDRSYTLTDSEITQVIQLANTLGLDSIVEINTIMKSAPGFQHFIFVKNKPKDSGGLKVFKQVRINNDKWCQSNCDEYNSIRMKYLHDTCIKIGMFSSNKRSLYVSPTAIFQIGKDTIRIGLSKGVSFQVARKIVTGFIDGTVEIPDQFKSDLSKIDFHRSARIEKKRKDYDLNVPYFPAYGWHITVQEFGDHFFVKKVQRYTI